MPAAFSNAGEWFWKSALGLIFIFGLKTLRGLAVNELMGGIKVFVLPGSCTQVTRVGMLGDATGPF